MFCKRPINLFVQPIYIEMFKIVRFPFLLTISPLHIKQVQGDGEYKQKYV